MDHTLTVIVAAVVMHNIAVMMGDDKPPKEEQLQSIRQQGSQVEFDHVEVGPPESVLGITDCQACDRR